jgi:tellurite resistance protein TehA-like permease
MIRPLQIFSCLLLKILLYNSTSRATMDDVMFSLLPCNYCIQHPITCITTSTTNISSFSASVYVYMYSQSWLFKAVVCCLFTCSLLAHAVRYIIIAWYNSRIAWLFPACMYNVCRYVGMYRCTDVQRDEQ